MLVIGVNKVHDVFVYHQNRFNCPWENDVVSQYVQEVQTQLNENVVH